MYLVINTENGEGQFIDIDLDDNEHDFVYKGMQIEDDILRDIPIRSDITKSC